MKSRRGRLYFLLFAAVLGLIFWLRQYALAGLLVTYAASAPLARLSGILRAPESRVRMTAGPPAGNPASPVALVEPTTLLGRDVRAVLDGAEVPRVARPPLSPGPGRHGPPDGRRRRSRLRRPSDARRSRDEPDRVPVRKRCRHVAFPRDEIGRRSRDRPLRRPQRPGARRAVGGRRGADAAVRGPFPHPASRRVRPLRDDSPRRDARAPSPESPPPSTGPRASSARPRSTSSFSRPSRSRPFVRFRRTFSKHRAPSIPGCRPILTPSKRASRTTSRHSWDGRSPRRSSRLAAASFTAISCASSCASARTLRTRATLLARFRAQEGRLRRRRPRGSLRPVEVGRTRRDAAPQVRDVGPARHAHARGRPPEARGGASRRAARRAGRQGARLAGKPDATPPDALVSAAKRFVLRRGRRPQGAASPSPRSSGPPTTFPSGSVRCQLRKTRGCVPATRIGPDWFLSPGAKMFSNSRHTTALLELVGLYPSASDVSCSYRSKSPGFTSATVPPSTRI